MCSHFGMNNDVVVYDVWGVWMGIALAVSTGWIIALIVAARVSKQEIGSLRG